MKISPMAYFQSTVLCRSVTKLCGSQARKHICVFSPRPKLKRSGMEVNMSGFAVRTDLALEDGERIRESGAEIRGVILEEEENEETGVRITRVKIETKNGAKIMGKPVGTYVTLEAPALTEQDEDYHREVSGELA